MPTAPSISPLLDPIKVGVFLPGVSAVKHRFCSTLRLFAWLLLGVLTIETVYAQSDQSADKQKTDSVADVNQPDDADQRSAGNRAKSGYSVNVPVPLTADDANTLIGQLTQINDSAGSNGRVTVVLRYGVESNIESTAEVAGDETALEDALRLARAMTGPQLRRVRLVTWLDRPINGHSVLPIVASDMVVVSANGAIADAAAGESSADETIALNYLAIAKRRGLFPSAAIESLVDPDVELAFITRTDGTQTLAAGENLQSLRQQGTVVSESIWSAPGQPLRLDSARLRSARMAAAEIQSLDKAAEFLDLADVAAIDSQQFLGEAKGVTLDIVGSVASSRSRRWQSNLSSSLSKDGINTWLINIDSIGGSLDSSAALAGLFADPQPPLAQVGALIGGESRGDSALIALACKPLMMKPDARLGGQGAQQISSKQVSSYDELIESIAKQTNRSSGLIRGILDPELEIYRYTNVKTGRIRYASPADLDREADQADDPAVEKAKWRKGEQIELADGLSTSDAIGLGLVDAKVDSLDEASRKLGLDGVPPPVSDRGLVRFVERLGRSTGLSFFLLFIGFSALSAEANAPGLSLPGFVALLCFALFFWIKFLAGTAEWLELLALVLGLICIGIEIFVLPGFGVFGIGGFALTVLGIVLMSQTFVLPRNVYQVTLFTNAVWGALIGVGGMVGGFLLIRLFFPYVPMLSGMVMENADPTQLDQKERIADYEFLMGQTGVATTPLRPAGKAKFADRIVSVTSDGSMIDSGQQVRVCEVHATRVVVESLDA